MKWDCIFQTETLFYESETTNFTLFLINPNPADRGAMIHALDSADRGICGVYMSELYSFSPIFA